jgi:hypothetical protein
MTRSSDIIARALDFALDKDPATLRVIIDIAVEYKIAVDHALKIERVLHEMIKDGEGQRGTE